MKDNKEQKPVGDPVKEPKSLTKKQLSSRIEGLELCAKELEKFDLSDTRVFLLALAEDLRDIVGVSPVGGEAGKTCIYNCNGEWTGNGKKVNCLSWAADFDKEKCKNWEHPIMPNKEELMKKWNEKFSELCGEANTPSWDDDGTAESSDIKKAYKAGRMLSRLGNKQ